MSIWIVVFSFAVALKIAAICISYRIEEKIEQFQQQHSHYRRIFVMKIVVSRQKISEVEPRW